MDHLKISAAVDTEKRKVRGGGEASWGQRKAWSRRPNKTGSVQKLPKSRFRVFMIYMNQVISRAMSLRVALAHTRLPKRTLPPSVVPRRRRKCRLFSSASR